MTDAAGTLTVERVQSARRRVEAYLAEQLGDLGVDMAAMAQQAGAMSGVEWLERWLRPEIPPPPPLGMLFGIEWDEIEKSRVALSFEPAEWMFSPFGTIFGGVTATVLDTVLGAAVHTALPAGTGYATTDLHTRFIRAVTRETGRVSATGTLVHAGRRHATADGRVEAVATGKLIATGTAHCAILRP